VCNNNGVCNTCSNFLWWMLGIVVIGFIDKDKRIIEWCEYCGKEIWWLYLLILTCWPVLVYLHFKEKHEYYKYNKK